MKKSFSIVIAALLAGSSFASAGPDVKIVVPGSLDTTYGLYENGHVRRLDLNTVVLARVDSFISCRVYPSYDGNVYDYNNPNVSISFKASIFKSMWGAGTNSTIAAVFGTVLKKIIALKGYSIDSADWEYAPGSKEVNQAKCMEICKKIFQIDSVYLITMTQRVVMKANDKVKIIHNVKDIYKAAGSKDPRTFQTILEEPGHKEKQIGIDDAIALFKKQIELDKAEQRRRMQ